MLPISQEGPQSILAESANPSLKYQGEAPGKVEARRLWVQMVCSSASKRGAVIQLFDYVPNFDPIPKGIVRFAIGVGWCRSAWLGPGSCCCFGFFAWAYCSFAGTRWLQRFAWVPKATLEMGLGRLRADVLLHGLGTNPAAVSLFRMLSFPYLSMFLHTWSKQLVEALKLHPLPTQFRRLVLHDAMGHCPLDA